MYINFLEASIPLTKTYTSNSKSPYPNVTNFTSHTHSVTSTKQIYEKIQHHAIKNHCLLKGLLQKPLKNQSRAGSTSSTDMTQWLCFDIDGISSISTAEQFMSTIGFPDVTYIMQWSSSYLVNGNTDFRAHIFTMADKELSPEYLKLYLKHLNLTHFKSDLSLTKTNNALHWGLDITTCQNDKLLYIAPPICRPKTLDNFPKNKSRIELIEKKHDCISIPSNIPSATEIRALEIQMLTNLRAASNLPPRKESSYKLKEYKGESYFPNPDQAITTGVKTERGFVYININGGDSWAYYHPESNPTFIYNFKGEPTYRTSELLPDYWQSIKKANRQAAQAKYTGRLFLAFRDFSSANYYNGWYDKATDEITLHPAKSERQLEDFLLNYGQSVPDTIPIWNIIYDPKLPRFDLTSKTVNTFTPSVYMRTADKNKAENPSVLSSYTNQPTPIIDRILTSIVGKSNVPHLINWLAFIFQERKPAKTAWVFHGIQGTGKGLLFNNILSPLFGYSNVIQKRTEELEDKFNDWLERALLVNIDEAEISESPRSKNIMANLKNQITEPYLSVRRMRQSSVQVLNYTSFVFSSNKKNSVIVEDSDRRFNIGDYQSNKILITDKDIISIEAELDIFAHKLIAHNIDYVAVRTPLNNSAKRAIQSANKTSAEVIADALNTGDLTVLIDALPAAHSALDSLPLTQQMLLHRYKELLLEIAKTNRTRISRDELYTIFEFNIGKIPTSPIKFSNYLKFHNVILRNIRIYGKQTKGLDVGKWDIDQHEVDEFLIPTPNVTPIKDIPQDQLEKAATFSRHSKTN